MAIRTAAVAAICAVILTGCGRQHLKDARVTELPKKPLAAEVDCEPLTEHEDQACLQEGPEARRVCRKVERNDVICKGNQKFVERLYSERDRQ